jgi:molybdate transport system substrate-binding protein
MHVRRLLLLLFLMVCGATSSQAAQPREFTVSAAISLKTAFEELGALHEKRGGAHVLFNFGASGDLLRQIAAGAPVDVFAAAAQQDMDEADKQGLLLAGTRADFAGNRVALVVPAGSKLKLKSCSDLAKPAVKRIAIGNPWTVPVGRYAMEILAYHKLATSLKERLVYGENARQVLDYVARGEVDAGVVYATDAASRPHDVRVVCQTPESSHSPVVYPMAVVGQSAHEQEARAFLALVLSDDGQQVLRRFGFQPAPR